MMKAARTADKHPVAFLPGWVAEHTRLTKNARDFIKVNRLLSSSRQNLLTCAVIGCGLIMGVAVPDCAAAVIKFDNVISSQTSCAFDGDGDSVSDVIFSTTDPGGFNTFGPGTNMTYIQEPGLEGTAMLIEDLRVTFMNGAVGSLSFGFALSSGAEGPDVYAKFRCMTEATRCLRHQLCMVYLRLHRRETALFLKDR